MLINGKEYEIKALTNLRGANLRGANLRGADLSGANLRGACLSGADLREVNFRGADLREVNFRGADLCRANLRGADLSEANLREACLSWACLSGADLREANFRGADLRGAYLSWADLRGANLRGADLREAYLEGAKFPAFQIPQEGELIVWKKTDAGVCKLRIPPNAKRTASIIGRKCRAEFVEVLEAPAKAISSYDGKTLYEVGKTIYPDEYNDDPRVECTHGIHFFLTKEEAE